MKTFFHILRTKYSIEHVIKDCSDESQDKLLVNIYVGACGCCFVEAYGFTSTKERLRVVWAFTSQLQLCERGRNTSNKFLREKSEIQKISKMSCASCCCCYGTCSKLPTFHFCCFKFPLRTGCFILGTFRSESKSNLYFMNATSQTL